MDERKKERKEGGWKKTKTKSKLNHINSIVFQMIVITTLK